MTTKEFLERLQRLCEVHPEVMDAPVKVADRPTSRILYVDDLYEHGLEHVMYIEVS